MQLIKWLGVALAVSLGANFFFAYMWYLNSNTGNETVALNEQSSPPPSAHVWPSPSEALEKVSISANNAPSESPVFSDASGPQTSRVEYFNWLTSLAKAKEFEKLEFEVSAYLRIYPQDVNAMLLEAKAYYHNKPLNTALVHYHELLNKELSQQQREEVEKLIAVNTTRIVQQFSGDGAWDLLAAFLEPLVQVAPSNRQYLMALARAYGMQKHFSLMEGVLASFPSDDIRSLRLRDNITARLSNSTVQEPVITLTDNASVNTSIGEDALQNRGRADVFIRQRRGQFIASAHLQNTPVRFLVDTGASTTALSDVKFNYLDADEVEFLGLFNVNTAGGSIEAPIYKVNSLTLGKQTLKNTSVLVLPAENLGEYDGLLGMNVLSQFDLIYTAGSQTMLMYKKR
jgi:clan AA aspartic protease (TIGR02281 family)